MASLLALKKLVSSNLLPKSLCAARRAIPASRLFNSKAGGESDDVDEIYGIFTGAARQAIPASLLFKSKAGGEFADDDDDDYDGYWSDGLGDLIPASRLVNCGEFTMVLDNDDEYDGGHGNPFPDMPDPLFHQKLEMMDKIMDSPRASRGILPGRWIAKETKDAFLIRMDIPGLRKENVVIYGEANDMYIEEKSGYDSMGQRFSTRIHLPSKYYKCDQIKAEVKNGVLNIVVHRLGHRERADWFHVKVV